MKHMIARLLVNVNANSGIQYDYYSPGI